MFCPRNIEGIHGIVQNNETIAGCGVDYNLCDDDYDCEPGLKCCPSGCIYKCVVPEKLKTAVGVYIACLSITCGPHPFRIN